MPVWAQWALGLVVLALIASPLAWSARRYGRSARGGLALASVLFGLGEVLDPPSRHVIEAEGEGESAPAPGDPPRPG